MSLPSTLAAQGVNLASSQILLVPYLPPNSSPPRGSHAAAATRGRSLRLRVSAVAEGAVPARSYSITLRKPLGIVFAETKGRKGVYVEELVKGGNAEKSGQIQVNDVLRGCSAYVFANDMSLDKYEEEGYGNRLYTNWQKQFVDCRELDFDTVMRAISSNNERWGIFTVDLEFDRYAAESIPKTE